MQIGKRGQEIEYGVKKFFCDNLVELTVDDLRFGLSGKDLEITIKIKDPNCYGETPFDSNICGLFCKSCYRDPLRDLVPSMCCYQNEKCQDGFCEKYQDPKCHEIDVKNDRCEPLCKPCYRNPRSDLEPTTCCYPNERCEIGTCVRVVT